LSNKAAGGEAPGFKGSVRQIVTDAANPVDDSRFDYTAYGLNDTEKDYSSMDFDAKCPYKFAGTWGYYDGSGRASDQTTDAMTLCGHRFYSPGIARWLTEDPIGFAGGINLYAYCGSTPSAWVDPAGTEYWDYDVDVGYGIYNGRVWHHIYKPGTGRHWYYPVKPGDYGDNWGPAPEGPTPDPMPRIDPIPEKKWQPVDPPLKPEPPTMPGSGDLHQNPPSGWGNGPAAGPGTPNRPLRRDATQDEKERTILK
jgi:RHS repeat-associated protein